MNAHQPRTAPSYGYDSARASFHCMGAPIFGYDSPANYIPPISLEITLARVPEFRQFTSKERDSESGLDYFGARYYGSALGRCTSPDKPFADQHITNPQSWNLYAYVRNNPLSIVDPNGTSAQAIELGAWLATHEPQIAAAAEALMAAHHGYTLSKAIQELFSPQSPSEKIKAALGSADAGTVIEGIVAEHVREHFNGFLGLGEGDLVDVQVDVPNPDNPGELSTELDIQLTFAVVEVKSGTNALTHNLDKKQKFGLPVVVYAPRANGLQQRQIFSAGAIWVWDINSLLGTLDQLKAAAKKKIDINITYQQ